MNFFILPKDLQHAKKIIEERIRENKPLNLSLVLQKYINKYNFGIKINSKGIRLGEKKSGLKRQILLLSKERIDILSRYKEYKKSVRSLEECDLDGALDKLNKLLGKSGRGTRRIIQQIVNELIKIKLSIDIFTEEYGDFFKRYNALLQDSTYSPISFDAKLKWRFIIGLGVESVYETSIKLHSNYSIPIIPGSALKGVSRAWAFYEKKKEKVEESEIRTIMDRYKITENEARYYLTKSTSLADAIEKLEIFGTQNKEGGVIFFDSLPIYTTNKRALVLDIMSPHYSEYYIEGKTPGDWMQPNPIFFLTVEGLTYRFWIGARDGYGNYLEKAKNLLLEALKNIGVGAKTSVGYGYFNTGRDTE